ncbi:hypothetical protein [Pseudomonas alcaligenes]|uniref:hypothetical protein n=1 Tax=Aquipseudomonas alcaligenes TaxID=43263 RepID=UPI00358E25EF
MAVAKRITQFINLIAATIALYAALFYWTREWIEFSPKSIPWLIYTLTPYLAFWWLSKKLFSTKSTLARSVLFTIAAALLLLITGYAYLQFTNESLVFYLRQMLFFVPILSTTAGVLLIGIGSLLTRR